MGTFFVPKNEGRGSLIDFTSPLNPQVWGLESLLLPPYSPRIGGRGRTQNWGQGANPELGAGGEPRIEGRANPELRAERTQSWGRANQI